MLIAIKCAVALKLFSRSRYLLLTPPVWVDDGDAVIEFCGMWLRVGFCSDSERNKDVLRNC